MVLCFDRKMSWPHDILHLHSQVKWSSLLRLSGLKQHPAFILHFCREVLWAWLDSPEHLGLAAGRTHLCCMRSPSLQQVSLVLMVLGSLEGVTQQKSVCLMHSEAKQYWNTGVWSRAGFISGPSRENRCLMSPKGPRLLEMSHKAFLKAGEGGLLLQTSWCWNPLFWQLSR